MVGCFARAVNHECAGSCELFYKEAPVDKICPPNPSGGRVDDIECVPEEIGLELKIRPGTKVYATYLIAKRDLEIGDEITYNYLSAPDYVWKEPHVVSGCIKDGPPAPTEPGLGVPRS